MEKQILVLNTGSSSIKYQLFSWDNLEVISHGMAEKIGEPGSEVHHFWKTGQSEQTISKQEALVDHKQGLSVIEALLLDTVIEDRNQIAAIGHRLVHGGEFFSGAVIISEEVKKRVKELIPLAPLHNPVNLLGVEVAEEVFSNSLQVGVFDTSFYHSIPETVYKYALPESYYKDFGVRVYGFHGTSHKYITHKYVEYSGNKSPNLITVHLGNGASITAIKDGKAYDTSMGLSPLPGLVMGTRSGDIDPSIIFHLYRQHGLTIEDIEKDLNKNSGLKGLCGSGDLRDVIEKANGGDLEAKTALEIYTYRIKKYIGSYCAALGKVDAIIFTAGVGENSPLVRSRSLSSLEHIGIQIDEEVNKQPPAGEVKSISNAESRVEVMIIPTNEEKQIAIEAKSIT